MKLSNFLGDLQKADSAEKPDQHIPCDRLLAGRSHLGLNLRLCNGKGWNCKRDHEYQHGRQHHGQFDMFFRGYPSHQIERGLEMKAPTMLTNSRRHQAFISNKNTWPPNIRHQLLKMLAVDWAAPIAKAKGAV